MGASNFAIPENASKYFVVLTNNEEKFVECKECKSKYYEYEEKYEETKEHGNCLDCLSENLEWDEEDRSPEYWEFEEFKGNLYESLREKFPDIHDNDYHDNDRNYPSSGIAEIRKSLYFAGLNIDISITIIMTSAYYEGVTLDYLINFDIGNYCDYEYNQLDNLNIDDLTHELTKNELEELRENYFCQLFETDPDVLEGIELSSEVPMSQVIEHYKGIYFVEDDFFCNQPTTYTRDEIITITNNMHRYGGGFMKALSECIHRADHENLVKLQSVFADDFERYLRM